jgi:nuclear transport factor 2 (NTF2) superfamily protein
MATETTARPPLPAFTLGSAIQKVRLAEDGWNTHGPQKVALAYTIDSRWRNRSEFINGRNEVIAFLSRKWAKELNYRLGTLPCHRLPARNHSGVRSPVIW